MAYLDLPGLSRFSSALKTKMDLLVPKTRRINNKLLTSDITISALDIGAVTTVNTTPPDASGNVQLSAASVGAIPTAQKGVANGVATLDTNARVPSAQVCENGTWTPTMYGSSAAGNPTYSSQFRVGEYTKVGNLCTIKLALNILSKGGMGGAIKVSGLPFASKANWDSVSVGYVSNIRPGIFITAVVVESAIELYTFSISAGSLSSTIDTDILDNLFFMCSATYQVA